ncbi:MAG TPA: SDR family NAD(P)-dependent oxidoreductase [Casimicrobiaceae bacterium]|nr:SDR family NAD(P)-dependent oxidoreductase [Casimicrobiaceae bacterium]
MEPTLKPLDEQVIVITGTSSGIGLATAQTAAQAGAKLVLAARSEARLAEIADTINGEGGEAVHVAADVGREGDVRRIADAAIDRFGRPPSIRRIRSTRGITWATNRNCRPR